MIVGLWLFALFVAAVWLIVALITVSIIQDIGGDEVDRAVVLGSRVWVPLLVITGPFALALLVWHWLRQGVWPLMVKLIKGDV